MTTIFRVTIPLKAEWSKLSANKLLMIEEQRQHTFKMIKNYLTTGYLKCDVELMVTGDTYQSTSALRATATHKLSVVEAQETIEALGGVLQMESNAQYYATIAKAHIDLENKNQKA